MSAIWLQKLTLDQLVSKSVSIDTELDPASLARVSAAVLPESGPLKFRLSTKRHNSNVVLLDGKIEMTVRLSCQRCLEPVEFDISSTLQLALIASESDQASVPDIYESVLIGDGEIRLADFVEDEILLGLPYAARHAKSQCGPLSQDLAAMQRQEPQTTTNPFAGLADMLRDSH